MDGAITLSLLREFFTYFNMQYSLSVFDPESSEGIAYQSKSRSSIASALGLDASVEEPLIHSLIMKLTKEKHLVVIPESKTQNLNVDTKNGQEKQGNSKGLIS